MVITREMHEIVDFLKAEEQYALFAGFAAYLYTGVETSADIDIFVPSMAVVKRICRLFIPRGWKLTRKKSDGKLYMLSTLKKKDTTLDIVFSKIAREIWVPCKTSLPFGRGRLNAVSPEVLFLTKLQGMTSLHRTESKTARDRRVLSVLRRRIDVGKLRKLLNKLPDVFWTKGRF